ncbi:glycoside hydrolase family 18 protein [Mucilaginibacter terrae]|uniref:chitinase n=1 Tax=Mucilaginibacter terrae TaxID=1955052 RepID=A0ABU3GQ56_9SPHI|nr:glycoside hydrolase family 18 protein [Mucilaginibacter terrae]MDT3401913.1 chitinase [Mucilaginibacter terrae]
MNTKNFWLLVLLAALCRLDAYAQTSYGNKVVIGYVGGYRGRVNTDKIEAEKLTHINYAFINVKNNRAYINYSTDTVNLINLSNLKKRNPALKILISIGGWSWSRNFSDAALSDTSRKGFAQSAVAIVKKYHLDGIDIDWEYPAISGDKGNAYRPEDKHNYTLLLKALRTELDILQKETKSHQMLTAAVGGFTRFIDHTEMGIAHQYLDYVNLMTYDFYPRSTAIHHTNLYSSKLYNGNSADKVVNEYIVAGVPVNKLIMGVAFYGVTIKLKTSSAKGMNDEIISAGYGKGYTFIKDSLINKKGFIAYTDTNAKAPYIFNPTTLELMTYDDEASVTEKCNYVIKYKMAGVMFWEYDADWNGYLLNQIVKTLK